MASVLQPRPGSGDVVCGALALHLDEDSHVSQILSNPLVEGREQLQSVGGWRDVHRHTGAVLWRSLVCVLPGVEAPGGETVTVRISQLQLGTIRAGEAWTSVSSTEASEPLSLLSVRGLKSSVPASVRATVISGLVTKQ